MRTGLVIGVWLLACPPCSIAALDSLWVKSWGAGNGGQAEVIRLTLDQGYVMAGTESSPSGDGVRVVRVDSVGRLLWTRDYCTSWSLKVRDARPAAGGDFLIAGTASTALPNSQRSFLMRTNAQGDTLWVQVFGKRVSGVHAVQPAADGGCLLAGWELAEDSTGSDIFLAKTDAAGRLLWRRSYEQPGDEWAAALQATDDGGWIIAGNGKAEGGGEMIQVIRTDSHGALRWSKSYPMRGLLRVYDLERTLSGGYLICGLRNPPDPTPCTTFLLAMDSSGDLQRYRTHRSGCDPAAHVMLRATPSGFLIATHSIYLGSGPREMEFLKTDLDGEPLYRTTYTGTGMFRWELFTHYWVSETAGTFAEGVYNFFVNPHSPAVESISIRPSAPHPERSERHGPHDSFSNVYWADFTLNHRQAVNVSVYNARGTLVRTVADCDYCAGPHCEIFDGWSQPPGIYFLRVETDTMLQVKKVVLVR